MITAMEIENLITCKKKIVELTKKDMVLSGGHYKNDMLLESIDGKHKFSVFMRINAMFKENFSIGLCYNKNDGSGSICLIRCNGPHGDHINSIHDHPHFNYHIHMAREDYIDAGYSPEKYAEITTEYSTYETALEYFLERCNIINKNICFAIMYKQISMFERENR